MTRNERRTRRARGWVLIVAAVADLVAMGLAGFAWRSAALEADAAAVFESPQPSVVVGIPGGVVYEPSAEASGEPPTTSATPILPPAPTAEPTPGPAAPAPRPATVAPTVAPVATPAPPPPNPTPAPVVAAPVAGPDSTVAAFYANVEAKRFDAAYSLWSERMRVQFPRLENLERRFDQTADIAISELYVAEQLATSAKVQISFVETYDGGRSRSFVGWWDLILVDGNWVLDQPHF